MSPMDIYTTTFLGALISTFAAFGIASFLDIMLHPKSTLAALFIIMSSIMVAVFCMAYIMTGAL